MTVIANVTVLVVQIVLCSLVVSPEILQCSNKLFGSAHLRMFEPWIKITIAGCFGVCRNNPD